MLVSLVTKYTNFRDNTVAAGGNDVTAEGHKCLYNSRVSDTRCLVHSLFRPSTFFKKGNHYFVMHFYVLRMHLSAKAKQ